MEFIKYTFVCDPDECDALLEFTCRDGFDFPNGEVAMTCPCGRKMQWIEQKKKEDKEMEATTKFLQEQVSALTALRENHETLIESLQKQLTELSGPLHTNCDYWKAENGRIQSQVIDVIDEIYAGNWNDEKDIANTLCHIIDYTPTREINFTATINFSGTIQVPASEAEDFDLTSILEDAYVDINHGDVVIDDYQLYDANEC